MERTRKIFISYRRDQSSGDAGRLRDRLVSELGEDSIFMDVDGIPLGRNFAKQITAEVQSCDALLAIIGPHWLDARDLKGNRRLEDPRDFVRLEIGAALQRDIPVIPILINGTSIPRADRLPAELEELALRNGLDVRHASFHADVTPLIRQLKKLPSSVSSAKIELGEAPSDQVANSTETDGTPDAHVSFHADASLLVHEPERMPTSASSAKVEVSKPPSEEAANSAKIGTPEAPGPTPEQRGTHEAILGELFQQAERHQGSALIGKVEVSDPSSEKVANRTKIVGMPEVAGNAVYEPAQTILNNGAGSGKAKPSEKFDFRDAVGAILFILLAVAGLYLAKVALGG